MTNAIEVTKHLMYQALKNIPHMGCAQAFISQFESALEAHLEQLRQDHEALHITARERFESIQALEQANEELRKELQGANNLADQKMEQLAAMRQERDDIQGRLHAIDHAYSVQQQATGVAGGELRALQDQIGHLTRTRELAERLAGYRLKQLDGTLQELSTLRKSQTGTSTSDSKEKPASEARGGESGMVLDVTLVDCQRIVTNWAIGSVKAKESMRQLQVSLNQKVELVKEQGELERSQPLVSEACVLCNGVEPGQCFLCTD